MKKTISAIAVLLVLLQCRSVPKTPQARRVADARKAVAALQRADFMTAAREADFVLKKDGDNPQALLVKSIALFRTVTKRVTATLDRGLNRFFKSRNFNHNPIRKILKWALVELARIESNLRRASRYRWVTLELNLASWVIDWNGNGRIDGGDRRLMQVEYDRKGNRIPENDPRRKPTYRFDIGDVHWALAYVSFQQAALNLLLAFEVPPPSEMGRILRRGEGLLVIRLVDSDYVSRMKKFLLQGLKQSGLARKAYLQETDDDREWVPNPRQKDGPMLMPVDVKFYGTWKTTLRDLEYLVRGREGLDIRGMLTLFIAPRTLDRYFPVEGYLNIGRMLSRPSDIRLNMGIMRTLGEQMGKAKGDRKRRLTRKMLKEVFGRNYRLRMRPSPLSRRLHLLKREMVTGVESMDRKIKYLLWIN